MVQFFSSSSQIITPPLERAGDLDILKKLKTLTNRYHSQLPSAKTYHLLFIQIHPPLEIYGKLYTIFFTVATLIPPRLHSTCIHCWLLCILLHQQILIPPSLVTDSPTNIYARAVQPF